MVDDIKVTEDELESLFKEVDQILKDLPNLTGRDKTDRIDYCRTRTDRIKRAMTEFRTEVRYLSYDEQKAYKVKIDAYETRYKEQVNSLQFAEKNEVTGGGVGTMSGDQMLSRAEAIQGQDLGMLEGMVRVTEQTKDIGADTIDKLYGQNEQLRSARKDVAQINSDLDIAKKTLRQIANRYATDRLILVFVVLVGVAILVAIIFASIKKKFGSDAEE